MDLQKKKELLLVLRHPQVIPYLTSKKKAISKLVELELSRSQREWNVRVSRSKTLEEVVESGRVNWTFQQPLLYFACRFLKPNIVVETGVDYGVSSALILQALEDNGSGLLYSVDLPRVRYEAPFRQDYVDLKLPKGADTGFVIPSNLRHRWNLIIGDSKIELPKLLKTIGQIDFFFHDSLHAYDHMLFEYETAYASIRQGGIIASDDVDWNKAFEDFCKTHGLELIKSYGKGFAVTKSRSLASA